MWGAKPRLPVSNPEFRRPAMWAQGFGFLQNLRPIILIKRLFHRVSCFFRRFQACVISEKIMTQGFLFLQDLSPVIFLIKSYRDSCLPSVSLKRKLL
jgi:hypothetical protein